MIQHKNSSSSSSSSNCKYTSMFPPTSHPLIRVHMETCSQRHTGERSGEFLLITAVISTVKQQSGTEAINQHTNTQIEGVTHLTQVALWSCTQTQLLLYCPTSCSDFHIKSPNMFSAVFLCLIRGMGAEGGSVWSESFSWTEKSWDTKWTGLGKGGGMGVRHLAVMGGIL